MKRSIATLVILFFAAIGFAQNKIIPNPASLYAKFMGYKSKVVIDEFGNQNRTCVFPDSTQCDEWSYFRGVCGQKYSYCALKGCQTETEINESSQYAVCVCTDSLGNKVKIPLMEFMEKNGDFLLKESKK